MKLKDFNNFLFEKELTDDQTFFLEKFVTGTWSKKGTSTPKWWLTDEGTVDVDGDIDMSYSTYPRIPVKFGVVSGNFEIANCKITSLEGCPRTVGIRFNCGHNPQLESLVGGPDTVHGDCYFSFCVSVKNLEGSPTRVDGTFHINNCRSLRNLKGLPHRMGGLDFSYNEELESLEGVSTGTMISNPRFIFKGVNCLELPEDQQEVLDSMELTKEWQSTRMSIEEFIEKRRGSIRGKKFGV